MWSSIVSLLITQPLAVRLRKQQAVADRSRMSTSPCRRAHSATSACGSRADFLSTGEVSSFPLTRIGFTHGRQYSPTTSFEKFEKSLMAIPNVFCWKQKAWKQRGREVLEPLFPTSVRRLVLGCIDADFCNRIIVGMSRRKALHEAMRLLLFCSSPNSHLRGIRVFFLFNHPLF